MTRYQELWWRQALSDHAIFKLLQRSGAPPCQQLHYLQMVSEKLAKAYLWRSGMVPPKNHTGFVALLRALGTRADQDVARIAAIFHYKNQTHFQSWLRFTLDLAYALERLAPALSHDGPNPEYPWPHAAPITAPAEFVFPLWAELTETGKGRTLLSAIDIAVREFPQFA